ncbi:8957_t:CDS:1, partial [Racocetra fulgida]
ACFDSFFNVFNDFVETLETNIIPDHLLPPNTTLFVCEGIQRGRFSSGTEYLVPLGTDIEKWIHDFSYNTHASYVRERTEYNAGNIEFRYTY